MSDVDLDFVMFYR